MEPTLVRQKGGKADAERDIVYKAARMGAIRKGL